MAREFRGRKSDRMSLHVQEWALVWFNVLLMGCGGWTAIRRPRPGSVRVGAFVICGSLGFMLSQLPRLLGWPHGVVMTLGTIAFVPMTAALVMAVRLVLDRRAARAAGGRRL
jgi:hypothetical protein